MARSAALIPLLALCLMVPASAQSVTDVLNNPALKPFITPFIGTPECLADITGPSSAAFDINTCQGLLTMLDALALGNTNPPVTCELSCVKQFALLSETCMNKLMDKFMNDNSDVGRLAIEFFEECDAAVRGETGAPVPAPAPAPLPAAADEEEPAAAPASDASEEAPPSWYTPTPVSAAASVLPTALLSMLSIAAAAFIVLA